MIKKEFIFVNEVDAYKKKYIIPEKWQKKELHNLEASDIGMYRLFEFHDGIYKRLVKKVNCKERHLIKNEGWPLSEINKYIKN